MFSWLIIEVLDQDISPFPCMCVLSIFDLTRESNVLEWWSWETYVCYQLLLPTLISRKERWGWCSRCSFYIQKEHFIGVRRERESLLQTVKPMSIVYSMTALATMFPARNPVVLMMLLPFPPTATSSEMASQVPLRNRVSASMLPHLQGPRLSVSSMDSLTVQLHPCNQRSS